MEITTVIPKERLTSCEKWKLDSLDSPVKPSTEDQQSTTAPSENQQAKVVGGEADKQGENKVALPTEEEISVIFEQVKKSAHKQGYEEGYKSGYQEGQNKGYQESRQEGESEIKTELGQVSAVLANLDQHLQTIDQQVAQEILALSINLTKKMISQALIIHPEYILPIVQDAIRQLPVSMEHPQLYLHPEDAKVVRQHLNEQLSQDNWEIRDDDQLTKGGCRIEAGGSEMDATIETRWRRVLAAIGQKDDWITEVDQHA